MRKTIVCISLLLIIMGVDAQTITMADNDYGKYKACTQNGTVQNIQGYEILLKTANEYKEIIGNYEEGTQEYEHCKIALLEIFPKLHDGTYFFSNINNESMALQCSQVFVDISLMYQFSDANLMSKEEYPLLSYFVAHHTYMSGNYQDALLYFKAYLSTTDTKYREDSFQGLALSYYELNDFGNVKFIAEKAILQYPDNWNIIVAAIKSCEQTKDYANMQKFLSAALQIRPDENGLLKNMALCLEKQNKFEQAIGYWTMLDAVSPNNLEIYTHLAFNHYNMGVDSYLASIKSSDMSMKSQLENKAKASFAKAAPLLLDVLDNSPYAANVARARAMCFNVLQNKHGLEEANQALMAMHAASVKSGENPQMDVSYTPMMVSTPVSVLESKPEFISDIDMDLPKAVLRNNDTYVVVIGNEKYKYVSEVDYAENDSKSFCIYCQQVLGIPKDHIRLRQNASLSEIREQINFLANKAEINPGKLSVIFYYSGHGIPNMETGSAYLLPTDASGTDFDSCYELDRLYTQFNAMNVKRVTVFLDACFSGATRNGGLLFKERYAEIEPKEMKQIGKTVVFSAATGKQTALPYDEQHHGYFTYHLLKTLKETHGDITYEELGNRVAKDVVNMVYDQKNKMQNPQVKAANSFGNSWKSFKLIE